MRFTTSVHPSLSNQEKFRHLKCFVFESLTPLLAKSMHDLCLRKLAPSSPLGNTSSKVSHFVQLVFLTRFYRHIGLNFVGRPMYPLPLDQLVALWSYRIQSFQCPKIQYMLLRSILQNIFLATTALWYECMCCAKEKFSVVLVLESEADEDESFEICLTATTNTVMLVTVCGWDK